MTVTTEGESAVERHDANCDPRAEVEQADGSWFCRECGVTT